MDEGSMRGARGRTAGLALVVVLAALLPLPVSAQSLDDAVAEGRRLLSEFVDISTTPGVSIAVMVGDSLVWAQGFGLASVEHEVPVTPETRFRIGSISKSLTSVGVGLLVQRGRLDLDAPVQTYVPSFPEKAHPITTRHLGGHLSGIPHYDDVDMVNRVHYESVTHALDKFKDRPLLFEPGERFEYSSFGFNLISAVVEGAAGRPFLEFMEEEVFDPLGMEHTVPDRFDAIIPDRTEFYFATEDGPASRPRLRPGRARGELRHAPFVDNSDVWAGGGFLSTPTDLVTFGRRLLEGALLEAETRDLLWTSMRTNDGEETGYGFGWFVRTAPGGGSGIGHTGGHFGATALLSLYPSEDVVVAVTANLGGSGVGQVAERIIERFREVALGGEPPGSAGSLPLERDDARAPPGSPSVRGSEASRG